MSDYSLAPGAPRPRRLRRSPAVRRLVSEHRLHAADLVLPTVSYTHLTLPTNREV